MLSHWCGVGLYLTDITFCREGNPSHRTSPKSADKKLLNFNKYHKLARIVQGMSSRISSILSLTCDRRRHPQTCSASRCHTTSRRSLRSRCTFGTPSKSLSGRATCKTSTAAVFSSSRNNRLSRPRVATYHDSSSHGRAGHSSPCPLPRLHSISFCWTFCLVPITSSPCYNVCPCISCYRFVNCIHSPCTCVVCIHTYPPSIPLPFSCSRTPACITSSPESSGLLTRTQSSGQSLLI